MIQNLIHNDSLPGRSALKNSAAVGAESAETCLEFESISALFVISAAQHPGQIGANVAQNVTPGCAARI